MQIRVDREACQTAATCLLFQLKEGMNMYELDDDSIAVIKTSDGSDSNHPEKTSLTDTEGWVKLTDIDGYQPEHDAKMREIALDAAKSCPFNAIIVEDDDGQVIWPEEI